MRKSLFSRDYDTFVAMLRALRTSADVKQIELAKRLKQTQSFISKCETGERRLDVLEVRQWCKALGVDFVQFIRDVNQKLSRR